MRILELTQRNINKSGIRFFAIFLYEMKKNLVISKPAHRHRFLHKVPAQILVYIATHIPVHIPNLNLLNISSYKIN
jgi:hypothetical protein